MLILKKRFKESLVSSYIAVSRSLSPNIKRIYRRLMVGRLALLSRSNANSSAEKQRDAPLRVFIAVSLFCFKLYNLFCHFEILNIKDVSIAYYLHFILSTNM